MIYQRILLPLDGSHHSLLAVEHAFRLAQDGGTVVLLTVLPEIPALLGGDARQVAESDALAEAELILEPVRSRLSQSGIAVEERVMFANHPGNAILVAVAEARIEVVVMGSRGRSELEGLVLGSVTHRVLNLSKVPVLVVNEG